MWRTSKGELDGVDRYTAVVSPPRQTTNSSLLITRERCCIPAVIIKPRLILVTPTDDLSWYTASNYSSDNCSLRSFNISTIYLTDRYLLNHGIYILIYTNLYIHINDIIILFFTTNPDVLTDLNFLLTLSSDCDLIIKVKCNINPLV